MNLVKVLFKAAQTVSIKVQDLLIESMTKAVKDVIESEIGGYSSDFKEQFKTQLKEHVGRSFDGMELTSYSSFIIDAVKSKHSEILKEVDLSGIENTILEVVAPIKKEYLLSDLIEMFKNSIDEYDRQDDEEIYFEIEENYEHKWNTVKIGSSDNNNATHYTEFLIRSSRRDDDSDGTIFCLRTNTTWDSYIKGKPATVAGFSKFQMLMLKIQNSDTKVIIDDVDTCYNSEEF